MSVLPTPTHPLRSVLVVGGCGFLGHHVVRLLQEIHPTAKLSVLDLHTNINRFPGVNYYDGDITSRAQVDECLNVTKPETVIDTVSPVHGLGQDIYFKINVEGTRTLLEASRDAGVKAFVWTSSASIVFDGESDLINVDETAPTPAVAMDAYNESKAIGEKMVLDANREGGMYTIALRLSGLFGEGDRQLLPGMLGVLERGQTKFQLGDNSNLFDFTYIGNSAFAHVLAVEKVLAVRESGVEKTPTTVDGETFFITNGEPIYFWDMPRAIWALKGHIAPYNIVLPRSLGVVMGLGGELAGWLKGEEPAFTRFKVKFSCWNRYFNITKAKTMLGYKPIWSLNEGLVKSVKWFDEQKSQQVAKKAQ